MEHTSVWISIFASASSSSAKLSVQSCHLSSALRDALNQGPLTVICKVVDVIRDPNHPGMLEAETRAYAALEDLQGGVISRLYVGYFTSTRSGTSRRSGAGGRNDNHPVA